MITADDWASWKLEDCCDILDNKRVPVNSQEREKRIGDIPYYGANGLQGYIDDYIFDEPLILIAEDGGRFDEFATRPIAYRINGKSWVNNHAHVLRAKVEFCQDAIFYTLEHKDIQPFIVGGTRSKLNQRALRSIIISLPKDKNEQSKIAEVLSTVDRAIEQTEALIAKQQRIKTGLMHDLLTRGIDEHGNLRSEETHEFKDSPLGRIPVGWQIKALKDIVDEDITYGIVQAGPHVEGGIPYIRTGDMAGDTINVETLLRTSPQIAKSYKRSTVSVGDIVFALRATVGKVLPITSELDGANLTQGTAKISPRESIDSDFLLWALRTSQVQNTIRLQQKGTTFMEITLADLRNIRVALPKDKNEQSLIAEMLNQHDRLSRDYVMQRNKLVSLKTALMQDLLTGKVRVTPLLEKEQQEVCA